MDQFEKPRSDETAGTPPTEPIVLAMPASNHSHVKAIIEKRLALAAQHSGISATIDDSGVEALITKFNGNLRAILASVSNCIRFAVEVQGKPLPVNIDGDLVRTTLADIEKTESAGEEGEPGKLISYLR